jgi:glyoxylase-like metal-dependent hydrolase (beta-lactamase superfamily II)
VYGSAVLARIAADVWQIPLAPKATLNAYLLGDVLVDAGVSATAPALLRALDGHRLSAHVATHAHLDHVGGSARVLAQTGVPFSIGARDREAAETGRYVPAPVLRRPGVSAVANAIGDFAPVTVAVGLREGDPVGPGFIVLDTPGHSPGHVSLWRESDRVLISGDVLRGISWLTLRPGLHEPPPIFTVDMAMNRSSARKLAELEPALICFGHGPPMRGASARLRAHAARS